MNEFTDLSIKEINNRQVDRSKIILPKISVDYFNEQLGRKLMNIKEQTEPERTACLKFSKFYERIWNIVLGVCPLAILESLIYFCGFIVCRLLPAIDKGFSVIRFTAKQWAFFVTFGVIPFIFGIALSIIWGVWLSNVLDRIWEKKTHDLNLKIAECINNNRAKKLTEKEISKFLNLNVCSDVNSWWYKSNLENFLFADDYNGNINDVQRWNKYILTLENLECLKDTDGNKYEYELDVMPNEDYIDIKVYFQGFKTREIKIFLNSKELEKVIFEKNENNVIDLSYIDTFFQERGFDI